MSDRFSVLTKRLDQALAAMHSKKLGISVNNWKIMRAIASHGPLSATELGCRTSVDPDKITRAVDTLVERSYVIRKDDEADRRRVVLTLSAKGRRVHDKIESVARAQETALLRVLNVEERKALLVCLKKLEQHSDTMFGRRAGSHERRPVATKASRSSAVRGTSGRTGRATTRKLVVAE